MKICTIVRPSSIGPCKRLGILLENSGDLALDANLCWQLYFEKEGRFNPAERAHYKLPSLLSDLLKYHDSPLGVLQETMEVFEKLKKSGTLTTKSNASILVNESTAKLGCPLDKISSYRDFYAHEKHVKTSFQKRKEEIPPSWYEMPVFYKGNANAFIGPEEEILWPSYTKQLDYELELGMIVGKEGRNIKEDKAIDHIFGFTILNDISARDIQRKEMSVRLGPSKGKDFCSVMGPVITTIDEFKTDKPNLLMTAKINGEEWSRGQSGDAFFSFGQMMAFASQDEWLLPGDFFGSGTVGTGCGLELDRWIQPGDRLELSIEKIGILKNTVGTPNMAGES